MNNVITIQFPEIKLADSGNYVLCFVHLIWHKCAMFSLAFLSYARKITNITISRESQLLYGNNFRNGLRYHRYLLYRVLSQNATSIAMVVL
jgi:hypothetical protein